MQAELQQVHPSQRGAYIQSLAPDLQGYFTDPSALPPPQWTPGELAQQEFDKRRLAIAQGYTPSPFDEGYAFMENVIGRNPNADYTKALRDRSFMSPDAFKTYADEGFTPRSDVLKNEAAAARDTAEATFTAGPKTATEYAHGGLYGAQTGESKARTGKLQEETVTERELRDPNSGATKARSQTGGRKSSAQEALERANEKLTKLSAQEQKIITEIAGERAALGEEKPSPYLKKLEAQLNQTRKLLQQGIQQRDRIGKGATGAGAAPPTPTPRTGRFSAINPETKQAIVSDDGVTWFDAATGARVE